MKSIGSGKFKLDPNWMGVLLVIVGFVLSLIDVSTSSVHKKENSDDRLEVVRILHWQLEPGFRESLQFVIDRYNQLPHVIDRGYMVQQMAVTERVYEQFLNVHLISGTAPDLVAAGKAKFAENRSRYFEPFDDLIKQPNRYNQNEFLPNGLDAELSNFLKTAPWQETFVDGLQTSEDRSTGYTFTVPISSWGTIRLYYNLALFREVKSHLVQEIKYTARALWLSDVLIEEGETVLDGGYIAENPELWEWLSDPDQLPQTFGQFILFAEGVNDYAANNDLEKLVAVSGSSYSNDLFVNSYNVPVFHTYEGALDFNKDSNISHLEALAGWELGYWSFDDKRVKAFYEVLSKLSSYFPPGFLGLDREQANRRFILGNAAALATGAWDAAGIFEAARGRSNEEDRFQVAVGRFPLPASGEKYGDLKMQPKAESMGGGVPIALYKYSKNKDKAIDFLQFITSYSGANEFVQESGWIPLIVGVEANEDMQSFVHSSEGVKATLGIHIVGGNLETLYKGQLYLYLTGDISYEEFVESVESAMSNERNGVRRQWYDTMIVRRDTNRIVERSLSVQRFQQLQNEDLEFQSERYRTILYQSLGGLSGRSIQSHWNHIYDGQAFPTY